ncbi:MAG: hypothetical protein RL653_1861 [Pseudomonadota bacterium]|jgi:serine/threonine protein kinase
MTTNKPSKTPTATRNVKYDRLPYPLGACWTAALRTRDTSEVYRALEHVLRFMCAVVWTDVLDLPWSDDVAQQLSGGPNRDGLERMAMGDRVALLRTLVKLHATAPEEGPPRVLPPLTDWWEDAEKWLAGSLQERNKSAHGMAFREDGFDAAADRLAHLLRLSRWLQEVQLCTVTTAGRKLGVSRGAVQRLVGLTPFEDPKHQFDATWRSDLSDGYVLLGSGDGTRWALCPFLVPEGRGLSLLDAIGRKGEFVFGNPLAAPGTPQPEGRGIPSGEGDLRWHAFLAQRAEMASEFRFVEEKPHELLRLPPVPGTSLEAGQMLGEDLRLVKLLGEGGMATVWEAEDVHSKQRCAVKVPKPEMADTEFEARFRREIELLKRLHAEGVRHVLGPVQRLRVELDDAPLTVLQMPLLTETLADRLKGLQAKKQLPAPEEVARWMEQALEALADLHGKGVIHRDIKPSNLLLDGEANVVLGDFGIARDEGNEAKLTKTITQLGSLHYMAPELNRSAKNVSEKSDIFSLAVTVHELARGKVTEAPGRGVSGLVGELLVQMGKGDPEERPTAAEVLKRIESSRDTDPPGVEPKPVRIEPGEFVMGASEGDEEALAQEKPSRRIQITHALEVWNVPFTQRQFQEVMGENPSKHQGRSDRPVENISWFEAIRCCNALSVLEGIQPAYNIDEGGTNVTWRGVNVPGWRLPTEAEWEFFCRSGSVSSRYGRLEEVAWFGGNSGARTHAVGLKHPNAWGLYDTLGHVWEWCWDWDGSYWDRQSMLDPDGRMRWSDEGEAVLMFGKHRGRTLKEVAECEPDYLRFVTAEWDAFPLTIRELAGDALAGVFPIRMESEANPIGPLMGEFRLLRGGSWNGPAALSRASSRDYARPSYRLGRIGFRPVRTISN